MPEQRHGSPFMQTFRPVQTDQLPFQDVLTQAAPTPQTQEVQPYGGQSRLATGLMIANKFMEGATEKRIQNFKVEEMDKQAKMRSYVTSVQSILADPNVLPEKKQQIQNEMLGVIGGQAGAEAKKGGKKNPIVAALGQVFEGMAGGKLPKGTKDIGNPDEMVMKLRRDVYGEDLKTVKPEFSISSQTDILKKQFGEEAAAAAQQNWTREDYNKFASQNPTLAKLQAINPQAAGSLVEGAGGVYREMPKEDLLNKHRQWSQLFEQSMGRKPNEDESKQALDSILGIRPGAVKQLAIMKSDDIPPDVKTDYFGQPIKRGAGNFVKPMTDNTGRVLGYVPTVGGQYTRMQKQLLGTGPGGTGEIWAIDPQTGRPQFVIGRAVSGMRWGTRWDPETGSEEYIQLPMYQPPPPGYQVVNPSGLPAGWEPPKDAYNQVGGASSPTSKTEPTPSPKGKPASQPLFVVSPPGKPQPSGMTEPGNIDLIRRPIVKNADGTTSTVRSLGVNVDGQEVLIPTVHPDGRIMPDEEAIAYYKKTGQHLGKFKTTEDSNRYAGELHNAYESGQIPVSGSSQRNRTDRSSNLPASPFAPPAKKESDGKKKAGGISRGMRPAQLDQKSREAMSAIDSAELMANELFNKLQQPGEDGRPLYETKEVPGKLESSATWLKYRLGFNADEAVPFTALYQVVGGLPFMKAGTSNRKSLDQIQEHLPKPTDSPQLKWTKINAIRRIVPVLRKIVERNAASYRVGSKIVTPDWQIPETEITSPQQFTPPPPQSGKTPLGQNPF